MRTRQRNAPAELALGEGNGYLGGQADTIVTPSTLDDPLWREGYFWGYSHGLERGRELADREAAHMWADVARFVQRLGSPQSVPFTELERRRRDYSSARPVPTYAECLASWGDAA